jgi:hypothetical protein
MMIMLIKSFDSLFYLLINEIMLTHTQMFG